MTDTAAALGAQTRNIVPPSYGTAPIPGRVDGRAAVVAKSGPRDGSRVVAGGDVRIIADAVSAGA
jgi:hypothetical protein